jgi:protein involved in polysaccharide export with SLBB domain
MSYLHRLDRDFSSAIRGAVFAGLTALLIFGTGCSRVVKNPTPLSDPGAQPPPITEQEYVIQPGDRLDIKFFYNSELNEQVTVRPDGRISLQLAHETMATGITPAELTLLLTEKYSRELEKPEITVIVRSFSAQKVFVGGEVNNPGILDLTRPMTVLQSIFGAGGTKDTARTREVIVIRRSSNNQPLIIPVNVEKVIAGTDPGQDITLLPFDVVFVPKSSIANVNQWVDQYLSKIVPSWVGFGVGYQLNPDDN